MTTSPTQTDYVDGAMKLPDVLPVLTLKDTVIFPFIILPLSVGRERSILAVDQALATRCRLAKAMGAPA